MRTLRGMLDSGRSKLEHAFPIWKAVVSVRSVQTICGAIALASSLAGATLQAQDRRFSVSDIEETAVTPAIAGTTPMYTPQPLLAPQVPLAAGQSLLNQRSLPRQPGRFAPTAYGALPYAAQAAYGAMPNAPSQVYPAAYYGPQASPELMPDPMMAPNPMMANPMMPNPMTSEYEGTMSGYDPGMEGGDICSYCGGNGCEYCAGHDGILGGFLKRLLPYSEGGACAPRWYDIAVDALYWTRDEVSEFVPFTSFTRGGPIIMSSDSLDYDYKPGMRFKSTLQVLPGASLEFTYFGMFSWSANTSVTSPIGNELFSPYSNFGALVGVGLPFDESDQAQFHSLRVSSSLDNFELDARKYWTGPNCRLQGSYRAGVRYVYLIDDLNFFTLGRNVPVGLGTAPAGQSSTDVRTHNSLVGFQSGLDLWAHIVPGISVGIEGKAGVYGNHAKQNTHVVGSTTGGGTSADLRETALLNDIAAVGEANLMFIWRVNQNFTIRGGYSAFYVDGVALAAENFNPTNPFNNTRTVLPLVNDGHVFYHGGFAGFEWMW